MWQYDILKWISYQIRPAIKNIMGKMKRKSSRQKFGKLRSSLVRKK